MHIFLPLLCLDNLKTLDYMYINMPGTWKFFLKIITSAGPKIIISKISLCQVTMKNHLLQCNKWKTLRRQLLPVQPSISHPYPLLMNRTTLVHNTYLFFNQVSCLRDLSQRLFVWNNHNLCKKRKTNKISFISYNKKLSICCRSSQIGIYFLPRQSN